jgi:hypothetical protein
MLRSRCATNARFRKSWSIPVAIAVAWKLEWRHHLHIVAMPAYEYQIMKEPALIPIVPPDSVLLILGAVTILFCIPLVLRMVKPNRLYGIRVPAAFTSDANWYRINSYGAKCLFVFGGIEC